MRRASLDSVFHFFNKKQFYIPSPHLCLPSLPLPIFCFLIIFGQFEYLFSPISLFSIVSVCLSIYYTAYSIHLVTFTIIFAALLLPPPPRFALRRLFQPKKRRRQLPARHLHLHYIKIRIKNNYKCFILRFICCYYYFCRDIGSYFV